MPRTTKAPSRRHDRGSMVPSWSKTDRRWVAQKMVNGKPVRATSSLPGPAGRKEAAERLRAKLGLPTDDDTESPSDGPTVAEVLTRWRDITLPSLGRTGSTEENYRWAIRVVLGEVRGAQMYKAPFISKRVVDLRSDDVELWLRDLATHYSKSSMKKIRGVGLSRILNLQRRRTQGQPGQVVINVASPDLVKLPPSAIKKLKRRSLTDEEIAHLLDTVLPTFCAPREGTPYGTIWESFFAVMLLTGMRPGEAAGLPWKNVDFEAGTLWVGQQLHRRNGGGWEITENLKTSTEEQPDQGKRLLELSPTAAAYLRKRRAEQAAQELRSGGHVREWRNFNDLVFTTRTGTKLDMHRVYEAWRKIAEEAGLEPDFKPHGLRHTFASHVGEEGGREVAVDGMGHTDSTMYDETYRHPTRKLVRIAGPVERRFGSERAAK